MAPTVVADVKTQLLAIRAKVDEAITHVEAGVSYLNENQIDILGKLVEGIEGEAYDACIRIARLLGRAESAERFSGAVKQIVSEIRDEGASGQAGSTSITDDPAQTGPASDQPASDGGAPRATDLDKVAEEHAAAEATGATTA